MRMLLLAMLAAGAAGAAHAEDRFLNVGTLQLPEFAPKLPSFVPKLVPITPQSLPGVDCAAASRRAAETQYPQILGKLPPARLEQAGSSPLQACLLAAAQPLASPLSR